MSFLVLIITPIGFAVAGSPAESVVVVTSVGTREVETLQVATEPARGPWLTPAAIDFTSRRGNPVPIRIQIPALALDAKIVPAGLDKDNAVAVPEDIATIGWYRLGVAPGAYQGSAVLVGHRDGRVDGHGAFYDLGRLVVGNRLLVTNQAGEKLKYRVIARESLSKSTLPTQELFAVDGAPRLTMITCGGYYDRSKGGYQDNVVVTAVRDYGV